MCRVSIPNGMEFYKKAGMLCRMLSTVSIPNGMEFYRSLSIANISIGYCFNSQRDGILPQLIHCEYIYRILFQFPTGWNSTLWCFRRKPQDYVSIPNGMEFYAAKNTKFSFFILVSIPNGMEFYGSHRQHLREPRNLFQFPTGWNSTKQRNQAFLMKSSFNSQRDGIPPKWHRHSKQLRIVSIPNGMEFYPSARSATASQKAVSIPNRMESR